MLGWGGIDKSGSALRKELNHYDQCGVVWGVCVGGGAAHWSMFSKHQGGNIGKKQM